MCWYITAKAKSYEKKTPKNILCIQNINFNKYSNCKGNVYWLRTPCMHFEACFEINPFFPIFRGCFWCNRSQINHFQGENFQESTMDYALWLENTTTLSDDQLFYFFFFSKCTHIEFCSLVFPLGFFLALVVWMMKSSDSNEVEILIFILFYFVIEKVFQFSKRKRMRFICHLSVFQQLGRWSMGKGRKWCWIVAENVFSQAVLLLSMFNDT